MFSPAPRCRVWGHARRHTQRFDPRPAKGFIAVFNRSPISRGPVVACLFCALTGSSRATFAACPPPGSGDSCGSPLIAVEGVYFGTTVDNTASAGVSSACSASDAIDEWYCYTASCTAIVQVSTCQPATNFDTTISVFSACGGLEIACNDDADGAPSECDLGGFNHKSIVTWQAVAGASYMIRIAGYSGATGSYALEIACLQACCLADGSCELIPPQECGALGGTALGPGSNCAGSPCPQACCFANGGCQNLAEAACLSAGGTPRGPGSSCAGVSCLQACCLPDGACGDLSISACLGGGGSPRGFDTTCDESECPQACCLAAGGCQNLTPSACAASGGISQCRGVACAAASCDCTCPGDLNEDGQLDEFDAAALVNCLLIDTCNDPALDCTCADLDADGLADAADIAAFVDASLTQNQCGPGNILPSQVLVVFNSAFADAVPLKNAYLAARPGIPPANVFDLNDPTLTLADTTYANFVSKIRTPIRNYLSLVGPPAPSDIVVILLIRPFPHRILDTDNSTVGDSGGSVTEFLPPASGGQGDATYASVDAELVLLWQNLSTGESGGTMDSKSDNIIDNPFHQSTARIAQFPRTFIQTQKTFVNSSNVAWTLGGSGSTQLTPGDMYLICRLDGNSLADALALVGRSQYAYANKALGRILLDEFNVAGNQDLDDDSLFGPGDPFNAGDDYEEARNILQSAGWDVRYDGTFDFIDGVEDDSPIIACASYGENHDVNGLGESPPPPPGTYVEDFKFPIGAIFNTIESFNARSINGLSDFGQEQVTDFVAAGGTFAVGHVWEPFSFTIPDNEFLLTNMLVEPAADRLQFAEAAYTSIPVLSWQHVALGDPLAKPAVLDDPALLTGDLDDDGQVTGLDIAYFTRILLEGIGFYRNRFPALDPIARCDFSGDCVADLADLPGMVDALLAP